MGRGRHYPHATVKCAKRGGPHGARAEACAAKRTARQVAMARGWKSPPAGSVRLPRQRPRLLRWRRQRRRSRRSPSRPRRRWRSRGRRRFLGCASVLFLLPLCRSFSWQSWGEGDRGRPTMTVFFLVQGEEMGIAQKSPPLSRFSGQRHWAPAPCSGIFK